MRLHPVSLAVMALLSSLAASAHADDVRRSYIVQLVDKPTASYTGQVAGLAATKPGQGQRLDVHAADVQAYINYLDSKQAAVMTTVGAARVNYQYNVVFNGFSAELTDQEVRALKANAGVASITADTILQLDTSYTPSFLGLDKAGGLWDTLGGKAHAGEGMVLGMVDSGIWPENPSFADRVDANGVPSHSGATLVYDAPPATWSGSCDSGEGFSAANCNNKLIGARFYPPAAALHWTEFASARDSVAGASGHGGHGTHTSSTAGGNSGVVVNNSGALLGVVSGMAPRARIATYKVCWTQANTGLNGCPTSSSVRAIDQAVKDGVNAINFSIGPSAGGGSFSEATEQAFLGAANAGVFVAASGGNSGPTTAAPAPVSHISPWLTTVANSTHNRVYQGTATLGSGVKLNGASSNAATSAAPLILSKNAGLASVGSDAASQLRLAQCFGGTDPTFPAALLDPLKVSGKIVVCDRGSNVLVNKSANARAAGAAGVIIANVAANNDTIPNQAHTLSTLHLPLAQATPLKNYMAANAAATASLGELKSVVNTALQVPVVANSSSRGPNVANGNILKPDVSAPGSDILAGVTADLTLAERNAVAAGAPAPRTDWEFYSGTSMASPHVMGVAALLKQAHPTWSPAMIKSALMTTAFDTYTDGLNGAVAWDTTARTSGKLPWGQGAGQIDPSAAMDPGLVYDAGEIDYTRFLCGINSGVYSASVCASAGTVAAYNLNLPSLTAANILGAITLTRTVTNVGTSQATYTASTVMSGFTAVVTPATLTLGVGESASYKLKLTRTTAPANTWAYGQLTWSDGSHKVRSPISARSAALSAPASVYSEATTGSKTISVGTGFGGAMAIVKSGLAAAARVTATVGQADLGVYDAACASGGPGVNLHSVVVPAGSILARFALYNAETSGGANSDLDLFVYNAAGGLVGYAAVGGSDETVQLNGPAAGTYKVCIIGYEPQGGQAEYTLSSWVLNPATDAGSLKVLAPAAVFVGGTASVGVSWSGLSSGTRYLGAFNYLSGGVAQGLTYVEVDTTDPVPQPRNARAVATEVK